MTRFQHEPFKKIIIKNLVHEDLDNLIHQCIHRKTLDVYWVNGMIIYIPTLFYGAGKQEYENMVKGIQYFQKVVFAKIPKYTQSIAQKNCVNYVRLLNYSNNIKFKELAKWIKSQPEWNEKPEGSSTEDEKI